jgi:hypothetical protein
LAAGDTHEKNPYMTLNELYYGINMAENGMSGIKP